MSEWAVIKYYLVKIYKFLIPIVIFAVLATVVYLIYDAYGIPKVDLIEKHKVAISGIMTLSILIAYQQFKTNTDLTRRQLSMSETMRVLKEIRDFRFKLDEFKEMDYAKEMQKGNAIPYQTIHDWICIKDSSGNYKGESGKYELTDNGKQIKSYIRATINNLEFLAIGLINSVFDEKIVKESFETIIQKTYKSFSDYIVHVRETEKSPGFAENLEWLADKWSDKKRSKKPRDS